MTDTGSTGTGPRDAGQQPPQRDREVAGAPRVQSDALLRGGRVVEIAHNGEVYRLQATRLGKLILTK
jgi:hemin uptake protein HemP